MRHKQCIREKKTAQSNLIKITKQTCFGRLFSQSQPRILYFQYINISLTVMCSTGYPNTILGFTRRNFIVLFWKNILIAENSVFRGYVPKRKNFINISTESYYYWFKVYKIIFTGHIYGFGCYGDMLSKQSYGTDSTGAFGGHKNN